VNSVLILRYGSLYCFVTIDLFRQTTRLFQNHPNKLEGTEYKVKTTPDSRGFAEFVATIEVRWPEVKTCNIDGIRALVSESGFEEVFSALEVFNASPLHGSISSIGNEPCRRVREIEEKNLQNERNLGLRQQKVAYLRKANSGRAAENRRQKPETNGPQKWHDDHITQNPIQNT
jgi:hypothetical protein